MLNRSDHSIISSGGADYPILAIPDGICLTSAENEAIMGLQTAIDEGDWRCAYSAAAELVELIGSREATPAEIEAARRIRDEVTNLAHVGAPVRFHHAATAIFHEIDISPREVYELREWALEGRWYGIAAAAAACLCIGPTGGDSDDFVGRMARIVASAHAEQKALR